MPSGRAGGMEYRTNDSRKNTYFRSRRNPHIIENFCPRRNSRPHSPEELVARRRAAANANVAAACRRRPNSQGIGCPASRRCQRHSGMPPATVPTWTRSPSVAPLHLQAVSRHTAGDHTHPRVSRPTARRCKCQRRSGMPPATELTRNRSPSVDWLLLGDGPTPCSPRRTVH